MPTAPSGPSSWWKRRAPFSASPCRRAFPGELLLDSVQLSLLMGPVFVQPVPRVVLDSLVAAEVKVEDVGTSGFQLTFSIDKQSPLQILFLLTGGAPLLFLRVILVATV